MKEGYSAPLQVVEFMSTRRGDADRGPLVRLRSNEAQKRLLEDGEYAWIYGPRRHELARIAIDDSVPRGAVAVRDVAGVAPSEIVTIIKVELDRPSWRPD